MYPWLAWNSCHAHTRLALNPRYSTYLCLQSAGMKGVCHRALVPVQFLELYAFSIVTFFTLFLCFGSRKKKFWCWFQLQIGYNLKCTVTYLSWFCNVFVWTYAAPFVAQAVLEYTIFLTQPATYWDYRNGPPWLLPTQSLNFGFFLLCWGWNLGSCICYAIALLLSYTSGSWLFYTGTKWWGKNIKFPLEFNASARTA